MKKKTIGLLTILALIMQAVLSMPAAAETEIHVGDYIRLGKYYDEPILWRCVDIDENGPLMLSDKIICLKPFDAGGANVETGSHSRNSNNDRHLYGSNYWADSNMRSWLNSEASAGNVNWLCGNPPSEQNIWLGHNAYDQEAGFLTNFSAEERKAMKTVTQKSIVAYPEYDNGIYDSGSEQHKAESSIKEVVANYDSAYSEQVTDTMFLLDVKQVNAVCNNGGILGSDYYIGKPTAKAVKKGIYWEDKSTSIAAGEKWWYKLRSPNADYSGLVRSVNPNGSVGNSNASAVDSGVRPAFYLNLPFFTVKLGSGTEAKPYVGECSGEDIWTMEDDGKAIVNNDTIVSLWAKKELQEAFAEGLVPDTLYGDDLTELADRAEFAAVAVKLYEKLSGNQTGAAENHFVDISGNSYEEDILKAYGLGITDGVSDISFAPDAMIFREQAAVMLARAYKKSKWQDWTLDTDSGYFLNSSGVRRYADDDEISNYAKESVYFLTKWEVLSGMDETHFAPKNDERYGDNYGYVTREQAIVIALRSAKYL